MNETITVNFVLNEISTGFRSLFYLVTPWESSYPTVEDVPRYVDKAIPFFFCLVVIEMSLIVFHSSKQLRFNDAMSSISAGLFSRLPLLISRNVELSTYSYVWKNYNILELPWDSAWTWVLCMLGVDLGYYWVHRAAHEINLFWSSHQVHHSSEEYNLSTALRQSVLQRYSSWIFYLPMAFFIPPSIFLVHLHFNLLYQFWIHTEVVNKLGPLEWVLNTASHHRVHHGRNRYCIDKNYAGVFIIWDRMFGTFAPEEDPEEIAYGVVHPINSWDPLYTQGCSLKYLIEKAWTTPGLMNKVWIFIKGPGWDIGKPRLGYLEDIPDIKAPQPKYDKNVSKWMTFYVWTHFALANIAYIVLSKQKHNWPFVVMFFGTLFILWTLTNIGYFYEHKFYTVPLELLRCCTYLIFDAVVSLYTDCPSIIIVPRIIFTLSAVWWLLTLANMTSKQKET